MSLTFITGIKFYKSILEHMNHMTYIYDPEWSPDNSTKATLPVCFFHTKGMHEVMATDVSQKPMLFYNSNAEADKSTVDAGLLNVVADNIVIRPKTYKLDVIIPYNDLSLLNQSFIFNTATMQSINSALLQTSSKASNALSSWSTMSQPYIKLIKDIIKALLVHRPDLSANEFVNNVMSTPDYNKNSLECMWQLRRILKLKVWNSFDYKYVVITDLDITKEGTEDGVYEATMTLQEMPIIYSMHKAPPAEKFVYKNPVLRNQGLMAVKLLDSLEVKSNKEGVL